jgi:hypothetical protein
MRTAFVQPFVRLRVDSLGDLLLPGTDLDDVLVQRYHRPET